MWSVGGYIRGSCVCVCVCDITRIWRRRRGAGGGWGRVACPGTVGVVQKPDVREPTLGQDLDLRDLAVALEHRLEAVILDLFGPARRARAVRVARWQGGGRERSVALSCRGGAGGCKSSGGVRVAGLQVWDGLRSVWSGLWQRLRAQCARPRSTKGRGGGCCRCVGRTAPAARRHSRPLAARVGGEEREMRTHAGAARLTGS